MSDIVAKLLAEANLHGGELAELLEGAASEIDLLRDEKGDLRTRAEAAERDAAEAYAKGQSERTEQIASKVKSLKCGHSVQSGREWYEEDVEAAILALPIKERP